MKKNLIVLLLFLLIFPSCQIMGQVTTGKKPAEKEESFIPRGFINEKGARLLLC